MKNFFIFLSVIYSQCAILNGFPSLINNNKPQPVINNEMLGLLAETTGNNGGDKTAQPPEEANVRDKGLAASPVNDMFQFGLNPISSSNTVKQKRCPSSNVVGSSYNHPPLPLLLSRRDIDADRSRCEKCKSSHLCAVLGKCNLCNSFCQQFENTETKTDNEKIPTELTQLTNNEAPIVGDQIVLAAKFGEPGTSQPQGRYYTVASYDPGTKMNVLARLLNLKKDNIEKLVVLAKTRNSKQISYSNQPLILDISHAFSDDNKTILYTLEAVFKNEKLKTELIKELNAALEQRGKQLNNLTSEEIDELIDIALETINRRKNLADNVGSVNNLKDNLVSEDTNNQTDKIGCSLEEGGGKLLPILPVTYIDNRQRPQEKIYSDEEYGSKLITNNPGVIQDSFDIEKIGASETGDRPIEMTTQLLKEAQTDNANNFSKLKALIHKPSGTANDIDYDFQNDNKVVGQENSPETLDVPVVTPLLQSDNQYVKSLDTVRAVDENIQFDEGSKPGILDESQNADQNVRLSKGNLGENIFQIVKTNLDNPSTISNGGNFQQVTDTLRSVDNLVQNLNTNQGNTNLESPNTDQMLIKDPTIGDVKSVINKLKQVPKVVLDSAQNVMNAAESQKSSVNSSDVVVGNEQEIIQESPMNGDEIATEKFPSSATSNAPLKKIQKLNKIVQNQPVLQNFQQPQASAAHQEKRLSVITIPSDTNVGDALVTDSNLQGADVEINSGPAPTSAVEIPTELPKAPTNTNETPTVGEASPGYHTSNLTDEFPYHLAVDFQKNFGVPQKVAEATPTEISSTVEQRSGPTTIMAPNGDALATVPGFKDQSKSSVNKIITSAEKIITEPTEFLKQQSNFDSVLESGQNLDEPDFKNRGQFLQNHFEENVQVPNIQNEETTVGLQSQKITDNTQTVSPEIVGVVPELKNDNYEEKIYKLGEIVPARDSGHTSKVYFIGNGIKLPLQMLQQKDGTLQLSVDMDRMCNCRNKTCTKRHRGTKIKNIAADDKGNNKLQETVGDSLEIINSDEEESLEEFNVGQIQEKRLAKSSNNAENGQVKMENPQATPFQRKSFVTPELQIQFVDNQARTNENQLPVKRDTTSSSSSSSKSLNISESKTGNGDVLNTLVSDSTDDLLLPHVNGDISKRSLKIETPNIEITNQTSDLEKKPITDEEYDEISKIRDLYQFQKLELDLENKLEHLNRDVQKFHENNANIIDKGAKTLFKTTEKDINVKRRLDIVNNMLSWMKNLVANDND